MNPYAVIGSGIGTSEAASLTARLSALHDAMVAHERRLRAGRTDDACDDECPHAEARALWPEAIETFGTRAHELTFLRTRATGALRSNGGMASGRVESTVAESKPSHKPFRPRRSTEAARLVAEL